MDLDNGYEKQLTVPDKPGLIFAVEHLIERWDYRMLVSSKVVIDTADSLSVPAGLFGHRRVTEDELRVAVYRRIAEEDLTPVSSETLSWMVLNSEGEGDWRLTDEHDWESLQRGVEPGNCPKLLCTLDIYVIPGKKWEG